MCRLGLDDPTVRGTGSAQLYSIMISFTEIPLIFSEK